MITEIEQQTLDIDWFLTDGKYIGFMASAGGRLPDSVAKSAENHKKLIHYFRNLPVISDFTINPELNSVLIEYIVVKQMKDILKITFQWQKEVCIHLIKVTLIIFLMVTTTWYRTL